MKLNNEKIKSLIEEYLKNSSTESIELIKKEVGEYVYFYPRIAYKKNLDICGEFYLYILERIEKVIKNFPLSADVRFQTWFNYVLKNNFINFMKYSGNDSPNDLSIEDYQDTIYIEVFDSEDSTYNEIHSAIDNIDFSDRAILKLYYLPELIDENDVKFLSVNFNTSIGEILEIQKRLIELRFEELENIRKISDRIRILNSKILEAKYLLYNKKTDDDQRHELMYKIARLEGERYKNFQRLSLKNTAIFDCLAKLFKSKEKASYRIKIAKEKFKFYFLKLKKSEVRP